METVASFHKKVWAYYKQHGRHTLPWRKTHNPYRILVSEVMLQQTQVERVLPKYQAFIKAYPTPQALARAPLADVLTLWVGLGYNRRAKYLKAAAQAVVDRGGFPKTEAELRTLPGVGPYTAAAVCAFAYNQPVVMIETNIRTVFLHHFFAESARLVSDKSILALVAKTLPKDKSREWYTALMDYGVYLKKTHGNNTKKSKAYVKQAAFKGSDRQIRGFIIRQLTQAGAQSKTVLLRTADFSEDRLTTQLARLVAEGLVEYVKGKYQITAT